MRVALVHDYLNQRGGAERVVKVLSDFWPSAPIYTSLFRAGSTFPEFSEREVRTTYLDRIPIDKGFRNLFPLYGPAFWMLPAIEADLVIASSSGWAHMARTTPHTRHIVYCHTPARWLYGGEHLSKSVRRQAVQLVAGGLSRIDRGAARRADLYVANSENIRRRIKLLYGIDSKVLHPPVDTKRLSPTPRGDRLLVISRLLPYKRVDLVVRAAVKGGIGLDVVGDGPQRTELERLAGRSDVQFHGALPEAALIRILETALAVCVPGEEDFGIVSVEAQAAGKPVVAFGRGGSLETIVDGRTGVLFHEQTVESVLAGIRATAELATTPDEIAMNADRFSVATFHDGLHQIIADMPDVA